MTQSADASRTFQNRPNSTPRSRRRGGRPKKMNGEKTQAFRVWETGQPGGNSNSQRRQTKSPTGAPFVFARAPLRTRAEAAREARSVWVDQGSPARNESVASERPSRRSTRPSPSIGDQLLFPRSGEVKALGREESGDEGYAAPNPARTRRGSVRRDRRSRYVRVLAPIARRNAARFTRSRPVQPRPLPCAPPKAVDKLTNNGARDDDNPTLTSPPVPNLRSRMRVPYQLRRLCGRHNLRMVRDRDRPSSANPDPIPARTLFFFKGRPPCRPKVKFSPPPPPIRPLRRAI